MHKIFSKRTVNFTVFVSFSSFTVGVHYFPRYIKLKNHSTHRTTCTTLIVSGVFTENNCLLEIIWHMYCTLKHFIKFQSMYSKFYCICNIFLLQSMSTVFLHYTNTKKYSMCITLIIICIYTVK